jgi:RHS repeat-associated protein
MYYYGYRFYDPGTQRWINSDPLEDPGFQELSSASGIGNRNGNLYVFVANCPVVDMDALGLATAVPRNCKKEYHDCLAHGLVVCTVVGLCQPELYWPCIAAYGAVCMQQYYKCLKGL